MIRPAFAYIRVSKEKQGAVSPETQRQAITEEAHRRDCVIIAEFSDIDWSATRYRPLEMPGFSEMVRRAEDGEAKAVIFYRVDRAVREHIAEFQLVRASLLKSGVEMLFAGREYDDSPEGDFALGLDTLLARLEARRIGVRMRGMHKTLAHQGKYAGNRPPFGWRRVRDQDGQQRLVLEPDEAALRRRLHEQVWLGWPLRRITSELNAVGTLSPKGSQWTPPSLLKMLEGRYQYGARVLHGEEVITDRIEPLLSRDEYERTFAVLALRRRWPERTSPRALRGTLVRCANCGSAMYLQKKAAGSRYRCEGHARRSCGRGASIMEHILVAEVERQVFERLRAVGRRPTRPQPSLPPIGGLIDEERTATEALGRLVALYAAGDISEEEFAAGRTAARNRMVRARDCLEEARKALARVPAPGADDETALAEITPEQWRMLPVEAQHDIFRILIDHVEVAPVGYGERIKIVWL